MRHHRRLLRRLAARAGVRLVCRRARFVSVLTATSALRWEVLTLIGGRTDSLRIGTGVTRREALTNAARTIARYYL